MNALFRWICCTLLFALPLSGMAEPSPGYGKRFPAQWLERDGEINLASICYNYPQQSYMYRLCRQEAGKTLEIRCQRYQAVLQHNPDNDHYRKLAAKYCSAARDYGPIAAQERRQEE
jgi:hypothetical protein